jgi:hypothetical protein
MIVQGLSIPDAASDGSDRQDLALYLMGQKIHVPGKAGGSRVYIVIAARNRNHFSALIGIAINSFLRACVRGAVRLLYRVMDARSFLKHGKFRGNGDLFSARTRSSKSHLIGDSEELIKRTLYCVMHAWLLPSKNPGQLYLKKPRSQKRWTILIATCKYVYADACLYIYIYIYICKIFSRSIYCNVITSITHRVDHRDYMFSFRRMLMVLN